MYLLSWCVIALYLLLFSFRSVKKHAVIEKINKMGKWEKVYLVKRILKPFGFVYDPSREIISSAVDAWQREFGYCALYDKTAFHFHMVLDCEPVYFYYEGKTWLVEFWKGQYGLNAGCEVGIYSVEGKLSPLQYEDTVFKSISDEELIPISMELFQEGRSLLSVKNRHWWLTGFRPGSYCEPEELSMDISLTFSDEKMAEVFQSRLFEMGYTKEEAVREESLVHITFRKPRARQQYEEHWLLRIFVQKLNRLFSSYYERTTKPFTDTCDKILYFYYFLPYAFRSMMGFQKSRLQKMPGRFKKKL